MKKFRKVLLLGLSFVVVAALAVAATVAYLQDEDSDVNVMTMGNVYIEQHELQRKDGIDYKNGGAIADGDELEAFEQGQLLFPTTYTNLSDYSAKVPDEELFWWGDYVTADVSGKGSANGLWDDKLTGAMDKFVFVENTGKSDAYYRTIIAFECPEGMEYSARSDKEFMMNVNGNDRFDWKNIGYTTIDGTRYLIMVATYKPVLEAGTISRPSLLQVVMTHKVTNEDVALIGDTYEILVVSQAVQTDGFTDAATALNAAFGEITVDSNPWTDGVAERPVIVSTQEELAKALTAASAAKAGDNTIYLADDIAITKDWTSIYVNGYQGAGIVTVEGQGHTITGLNAPLFDGGFAGESGIIIRNLTIADSEIKSDSEQGVGAFINCVDSMTTITLENCHLLNSTVNAPAARTGGLIGWTSGYSRTDDGPVKTYVTITDCSVIDCTITGTAVGGINGHAGASDWTYTTIENCTVVNNKLISYDDGDWRVGAVIGTANVGEVTITGTASGGNRMEQSAASSKRADGLSDLVGRFVPGTTGKLTVEGTVSAVSGAEEMLGALANSNSVVFTQNIKIDPASLSSAYGTTGITVLNGQDIDGAGYTLDITGADGTWDSGINTTGGTIKNLTINGSFRGIFINHNSNYSEPVILDKVYLDKVCYTISCDQGKNQGLIATNSTFNGWTSYAATLGEASFTDCNFGKDTGGYQYAYLRPYAPTTLTNCIFETGYKLDARQTTVTLVNCYVGDTLVTADNVVTLLGADAAEAIVK